MGEENQREPLRFYYDMIIMRMDFVEDSGMKEQENIRKNDETEVSAKMEQLLDDIETVVETAKKTVGTSLNQIMTETYWTIGKYIVEYEQDGKEYARYGSKQLTILSQQLTLRFGKGYSRPNLNSMRKFYRYYPICQTVSDKLSWSHICELIKIEDKMERKFYEKESIKEKWDVRTLRRQMDSSLFLRLAASRNKDEIMQLAEKGITYDKPENIIKDTYTLEFLGISNLSAVDESDLEQRIIDNMQAFLLDWGKDLHLSADSIL